jgi:metal-responsive CopG/Arc/MetJ family transcriptional regulator
MKTVVSIPDDVFDAAERLAGNTNKSRSQLYTDALKEYVSRHPKEDITEALNRICSELRATGTKRETQFVSIAARRLLEKTEW